MARPLLFVQISDLAILDGDKALGPKIELSRTSKYPWNICKAPSQNGRGSYQA